jgi:SM-20-related protein
MTATPALDTLFDFSALAATPLANDPFTHVVVPKFVKSAAVDRIDADWPKIGKPGAFPTSSITLQGAASELVAGLESPEFCAVIEAKLGMTLKNLPTMITFRDRCRARDGQIHTDSVTKVVTLLLYLNKPTGGWQDQGGKLRLLRGPESLDNYTAEIEPVDGTMLIFKCTRDAWHGHASYEGPRHVLQMNWMVDEATKQREEGRHKVSAFLKKLNPFGN